MVDIHTHLIPNVDDGSRSVEETFNLIEEARKARIYRHYINSALHY